MINILDYELLKYKEYITETAIVIKEHREYEILKNMKWYFIELPKFRKMKPDMENKLNQWLAIIDGEDRRLIEMAVVRNKTIKEAKNEVEYLTGDEEVKRINELKDKWERDRVSEMNYLKSIAQKEGLKEGRKSGLKEGLKEGRKEKSIDIAKNMLDKDFSIKEVVSLTGLSEEEVKTLKNDIKNI